ncbi:hypothetical protein [Frondihabitans sp. PAMC 28766]|uniref:hypothetical protein n=1 Tax=Frondihabitans sp. PAMC 28766 TaxID=1795630 RepID=UPI0012FF9FC2|nr:hypothetical protein [Frondihabitans sp. PAMC 28766]
MMRWRADIGCAVLVVVGLTACAGRSVPGAAGTAASSASSQVLWQFHPGERERCSEQMVKGRIAKAKASNIESNENSVLETPDELDRSLVTDAQYEEQVGEWKKLSPDDRIYQLCLAIDQHFDRS